MHRLLPIGNRSTWHAPKLSPRLVRASAPLVRLALRCAHGIRAVELRGVQHLEGALRSGHGVLITPNHVTYSDPLLLAEAGARVSIPFHYMTAWQVFEQSWAKRVLLPRLGCFSVDREGTDRRSFQTAVELLAHSAHPLVVFPEGEMHHLNDRVWPFHEGAAAMLLAACKRTDRELVCIPCGLKYFYVGDPGAELEVLTRKLEQALFLSSGKDLDLASRVQRVGEAALALKEVDELGGRQAGPLPERLRGLTEAILARLEGELGLTGSVGHTSQRVKRLRKSLVARLVEGGEPTSEARAECNLRLEQVFLVTQLFSYPGDYLSWSSTIEGLGETLEKLEEDVLGVALARPRGARRAVLQFGKPIDPRNAQMTAAEMTELLESQVQSILDSIAKGGV